MNILKHKLRNFLPEYRASLQQCNVTSIKIISMNLSLFNSGPFLSALYMQIMLNRKWCFGQTCRFSVQHADHIVRTNTTMQFVSQPQSMRQPQSVTQPQSRRNPQFEKQPQYVRQPLFMRQLQSVKQPQCLYFCLTFLGEKWFVESQPRPQKN